MIAALLVSRFLLAAVFAVAGIAKLADRRAFRKTLGDFGVPDALGAPLPWLLPIAELAFAAALFPVATAVWGAAGVLAMLVAFCVAISVNLALGRRPDCRCFGQVHSTPIGWKTLARNTLLSALCVFVIWQSPSHPEASFIGWLRTLNGLESAVLGLAALVAAQFWVVFHVLRQNGRLLLRIDAIEGRLGMQAEQPPPGLPVGSDAPRFSLTTLTGATRSLDSLLEPAKPLILAFSEPNCPVCDELLPELVLWQSEHAARVSIAVIGRGKTDALRAKPALSDLENVLVTADREVFDAYRVTGTPSAVLIREGRVRTPLAEGIDGIRDLVRQAILPPPVTKGEAVPSLRFADLNGAAVDLAGLRGEPTLLLFWNPSCGFCQKLLPDVKEWERNRTVDSPRLVVISAGSLQSNREQGFRSTVLLDPGFAALHVFSAGGTPSAVLIDSSGVVASDIGVGADEVLALAGAIPAR